MRKFFALALAVAMVLSLASVSFAAYTYPTDYNGESTIALSNFFKYSGDSDKFDQAAQAQYGKSYYALILEGKWTESISATPTSGDKITFDYVPLTDYDTVEKLKVKAEFEMGEDLVESVSIVKKAFGAQNTDKVKTADTTLKKLVWNYTTTWALDASAAADVAGTGIDVKDGKYYYCVEIKTKADRVTGDADIIGTLEFNRKANTKKDVAKIDDCEVDFNFNLFYEKNYIDDAKLEIDAEDGFEMKWDDLYVVKFNNDDEIEIEFGKANGDNNEGVFTVDVSGQGKLVIDYNTKANEAICDANPGAKMYFVNFNGAKFNRTGTFEYEMEDMVAAYQVVDDKLVEINGLELDGEVATFATRTLGNYVFADAELVNPVVEAPVVEAPAAVTNPSTGF